MLFALEKQEPRWIELLPARGKKPPVEVLFPPQPGAKALRKAREAAREVLRRGGSDAMMDAGEAFSMAMIRYSILDWRGIGDEREQPVAPTHDVEIVDPETGAVIEVKPGTISAFLAEPRLYEAADRVFVVPWAQRDAEKNGLAPSPAGTSAGAMPGGDTANSPARRRKTAAAGTKKPARQPAPTKKTPAKRTKVKPSGT